MKKFMKSAGWQIGAFVLAIGAAFATNAIKESAMFPFEVGYLPMNTEATICYDPNVICDVQIRANVCTWTLGSTTHQLYGKVTEGGVTKCIKTLYRIP